MPRGMRRVSKTGVYHIMMRGNEKRNIFIDKWDKQKFIDILDKVKKEELFDIFAYCIMPNHVHLIIKEYAEGISYIMKRVNISYAQYFNNKYERVGHVFQDRFKSEVIESDSYLLCAIRYVHNNPVRANMVKAAIDYGWSSYKYYFGKEEGIVDRNFTLSLYSPETNKAIKLFKEFTLQDNKDKFIDTEDDRNDDIISTKAQCEKFIGEYCEKYNTTLDNIINIKAYLPIRKELIRYIRDNSKLSLRELEDILGVSKSTINRV